MPRLTGEEISSLEKEYCCEQDDEEKELERELMESLPESSVVHFSQVKDVIRWKTGSQGGRTNYYQTQLEDAEGDIETVTRAALKVDRLRTQIEVLTSLPGVGVGISTAILGFVYPETHAVVDRYVYNGEFGANVDTVTVPRAVEMIEHLQQQYGDLDVSLRTVDRALFVLHGGYEG